MQALALVLLLAVSASAEQTTHRRELAIAGLRARQTLPPLPLGADPCATARRIVHQPPCLAAGDCPSLELWRRSFGPPRVEPLDPDRTAAVYRPPRPEPFRPPLREPPDPRWLIGPRTICPADIAPRR